ncbi:Signal peptide peptidase [Zea mays]|nr:Signal peptide peptidase [Zea mays]
MLCVPFSWKRYAFITVPSIQVSLKDLVNAVLTAYFFILGIVALSATLLPSIKRFLPKEWNDNLIVWRAPFFHSLSVEFTKSQIIASIPGFFFACGMRQRSIGLQTMSWDWLSVFRGLRCCHWDHLNGAILLGGLFVYDIFWVFFTPVMVSVAKSFDAPIKLLFPTADAERPFSMLGLGDIVIPVISASVGVSSVNFVLHD